MAASSRAPWLTALFSRHRIESRILLGFLGAVAGVFLLGKAASEVAEGDTLAFDRAVLLALRQTAEPGTPIGPSWLRIAMVDVTALGGVTVLSIITLLAAGYMLAARKPMLAAFTVGAVGGGAALGSVLKAYFERARPHVVEHLVGVHTASFPSSHAMDSAVTYLTLAVLLARAESSRALRIYLISVAIGLILLIGFSRLYLGVHWPSDVIGGWIIGALWAAACSFGAKALQSRRAVERSPAAAA